MLDVRARWIGHRLTTELDLAFDGNLTLKDADEITTQFETELLEHIPALASARIRARPDGAATYASGKSGPPIARHAGHHHAPAPVSVKGELAEGTLEIIDTPEGERMLFTATRASQDLEAHVEIKREGKLETLPLIRMADNPSRFTSLVAPEEPHEFDAELHLRSGERTEVLRFRVVEPEGHGASPHRHRDQQ